MFLELDHPMRNRALRITKKLSRLNGAQSPQDQQHSVQAMDVARFFRLAERFADGVSVIFHDELLVTFPTFD